MMEQVWIKDDCWIGGCGSRTTHVVESKVVIRPSSDPERTMDSFIQKVGYCSWDAKDMAVALVWNYDHLYEILDIRPVVPEDFKEEGEGIYDVN